MTNVHDYTFLNDLFGESEDPWHMRTGWQAERQRDLLLSSLNHARYTSTFEPGCASGELTTSLARRSDRVLAADDNRTMLESARKRTAHLSNVDVQWLRLPEEYPSGQRFDLVVLSEMGYLLDLSSWADLAVKVRGSLAPGATVLACHRQHEFDERVLATETLHGTLDSILGLERQTRVTDTDFTIDVWTNRDQTAV